MNEARAPNYELAYKDYQKGMKYKEIAEKYGVTINTVKSWKTRYKWSKGAKKGVHTKSGKVCTQRGGQPGNKNAVGHGAPARNKNAEKHGLFSKWLPDETQEIIETIREQDSVDMLYENILIQQAAIIRSQKIMEVKGRDDLTKELKKVKTSTSGMQGKNKSSELEYELQFAWDKQASYLQAQSRAMQTLLSMIAKFKDLTAPDDKRRDAVDDWIDILLIDSDSDLNPEDEGGDSDDET